MEKSNIRKKIIDLRNLDLYRYEKDKEIFNRLLQLEEFKKSKNIFIYLGYGSEINTMDFLDKLKALEKNIIVPWTNIENKSMEGVKLSVNILLEKNKYGILEPTNHSDFFEKSNIDLIIVPGVAFTKEGERLGYGGGYYDRYLQNLKGKVPLVALCYEYQILDDLPTEDFDVKVDFLISENTTIKCLKC